MTQSIEGVISPKTGLFPALKEIADLPDGQDAILRIDDGEIIGDIALAKSRYITGAYIGSTGAKGVDALRRLLSIRKGTFACFQTESGFDQNLKQSIKLDIKKLVAAEEAGPIRARQNAESKNKRSADDLQRQRPTDTGEVIVPHFAGNSPLPIPYYEPKDALTTSGTDQSVLSEPPRRQPTADLPVSEPPATKVFINGQPIFADLPEENDVYSLLDHFGLAVEQPVLNRLYHSASDIEPLRDDNDAGRCGKSFAHLVATSTSTRAS